MPKRPPFWTLRRVASVARLYGHGLPERKVVRELKFNLHPTLTFGQVRDLYFGSGHIGARPNFRKLFGGRSPREISVALRDWHQRTQAARQKQGEKWRGKKRPEISALQRGRTRVQKPYTHARRSARARESLAAARRGTKLALSEGQRAARSERARVAEFWRASQTPESKMKARMKKVLYMEQKWAAMSAGQKQDFLRATGEGVRRHWKGLTSEQRVLHGREVSKGLRHSVARRKVIFALGQEELGRGVAKAYEQKTKLSEPRVRRVVAGDMRFDIEKTELKRAIAQAIAILPKFEARAVQLRFGLEDGLERTIGEVAQKLGADVEAVTTALSSAMAKIALHPVLREYFKPK